MLSLFLRGIGVNTLRMTQQCHGVEDGTKMIARAQSSPSEGFSRKSSTDILNLSMVQPGSLVLVKVVATISALVRYSHMGRSWGINQLPYRERGRASK